MADGLDALKNKRQERTRRTAPPSRNPRSQPTSEAKADDVAAGAAAPLEPSERQGEAHVHHRTGVDKRPASPDLAELVTGSLTDLPDALAAALPKQRPPQTEDPTLTADEREAFARCQNVLAVVDAFWVQGLALETVTLGELHREDYESFDAFTTAIWGKSARRAYQLIEVAPLGRHLWTEVRKIFHTATINESQTKALLPFAKAHGHDAAALVMTTLLASEQKVTATLIRAVLATLPQDRFDPEETVRLIKDYLAADTRVLPPPAERSAGPGDIFTAEARRMAKITPRVMAHAKEDPDAARKFADALDEMAARIRAELT